MTAEKGVGLDMQRRNGRVSYTEVDDKSFVMSISSHLAHLMCWHHSKVTSHDIVILQLDVY